MIKACRKHPLRVSSDRGRLTVAVPWDGADDCQSYLRRGGLSSVLVLDPNFRDAHLELRPGTDPLQVQALLDQWGR